MTKAKDTELSHGVKPSTLDRRPSTLLLVDGHAYAYRSFYAIRGMPTGAVFGFIKALAGLREKVKGERLKAEGPSPSGALGQTGTEGSQEGLGEVSAFSFQPSAFPVPVVVWDGGLAAERLAVLPGYKAQRPALPAELGAQIEGMMEFLAAAGVASVQVAGVEADDLIAGLADLAAAAGWEVVIASSDKDFMQLVSEEDGAEDGGLRRECGTPSSSLDSRSSAVCRGRIGLVNPGDKSERVWGAAEVWAKVGVRPSQVVDWLALVGDAVDNIPGVPGVGAKTAARLLGRFGSVAGIYARLAEVESVRLQRALAESAVGVRRNVELVRLRRVLPEGVVSVEGLRGREPDWERLTGLFRGWGFRGLLAQAEAASARTEAGSGGRGVRRVEPGRDLVERQALLL